MADYTSFFLNAKGGLLRIDCIEISHPSFSKVFRFVRNVRDGILVKHEDGLEYQYTHEVFELNRSNVTADLDQTIQITFADYKDELKLEVESADYTQPATFKYRAYRDDDLSMPMIVLETLQVISVNNDSFGIVTFDAKAEGLNDVKTGLIYSIEDYPMLRALL